MLFVLCAVPQQCKGKGLNHEKGTWKPEPRERTTTYSIGRIEEKVGDKCALPERVWKVELNPMKVHQHKRKIFACISDIFIYFDYA